jgi:hypothetical protein
MWLGAEGRELGNPDVSRVDGCGMDRVRAGLVCALLTSACEPELVVGTWTCPPPDPDQAIGNRSKVVGAPWATGFETGFCD